MCSIQKPDYIHKVKESQVTAGLSSQISVDNERPCKNSPHLGIDEIQWWNCVTIFSVSVQRCKYWLKHILFPQSRSAYPKRKHIFFQDWFQEQTLSNPRQVRWPASWQVRAHRAGTEAFLTPSHYLKRSLSERGLHVHDQVTESTIFLLGSCPCLREQAVTLGRLTSRELRAACNSQTMLEKSHPDKGLSNVPDDCKSLKHSNETQT